MSASKLMKTCLVCMAIDYIDTKFQGIISKDGGVIAVSRFGLFHQVSCADLRYQLTFGISSIVAKTCLTCMAMDYMHTKLQDIISNDMEATALDGLAYFTK